MVTNGMSPEMMRETFQLRENKDYHLRHISQFMAHALHSVYNRSESSSYLQKQPPELFYKKAVLGNFAIFTGKQQCWSLFLMKLQARPATLRNF